MEPVFVVPQCPHFPTAAKGEEQKDDDDQGQAGSALSFQKKNGRLALPDAVANSIPPPSPPV